MAIRSLQLSPPLAVAGFTTATIAAGIKESGHNDMLLVSMEQPTVVAGVFTRNQVAAAPVLLCRERLPHGEARALIVNSGNANACTGANGMTDARILSQTVASGLNIQPEAVFIASTGIIGKPLPLAIMAASIPSLIAQQQPAKWQQAAEAIMTTDAFAKWSSQQVDIHGTTVTVTGIAKGAGMIHPDMATMLAFVFTDANITSHALQSLLNEAVFASFNAISVDGDTSTNDTLLAFASQKAAHRLIDHANDPLAKPLVFALQTVCQELAQLIVMDGEGATKMATIRITGARNCDEARSIGRAIATSPLVKTALHGGDPNWGRIIAAAANAHIPLLADRLTLHFGPVLVVQHGIQAASFVEKEAADHLAQEKIAIHLDLGLGDAEMTVWTCDLSREYIRINADYRT